MRSKDPYVAFDYFSALNTDTVIQPSYISLPTVAGQPGYTSIVNRAQIIDLANDCGCRFGVQRIMTQQIYELPNESGPNGERVFGVQGDKYGQIRVVGNVSSANGTNGQSISSNAGAGTGDFIEITFYGTGLNYLTWGGATTLYYSLDGGSNVNISTTISSILQGRYYSPNTIIPVVSGLVLGLHTVKIIDTGAGDINCSGIEILNETVAGAKTLNIRPGKIVGNNSKAVIISAKTPTYDASVDAFESGTLGSKGGCVIVYAKEDGTVAKAVTPTSSASPKYLTNADHVTDNEELIRTIHWREFGCGRSDDFSLFFNTGTPANKAFTIDDGSTTLVGNSVFTPTSGSASGGITPQGGGVF